MKLCISSLSGSNFDDIRQELLQSELKNEHLLSELQARESDIVEEKKVVEKVVFIAYYIIICFILYYYFCFIALIGENPIW